MGRPPVDSDLVRARVDRRTLDALDEFAEAAPGGPIGRPEAIRRILGEVLLEGAQQSGFSEPEPIQVGQDDEINAYFASSAPGVGAHFMRAIIGHLRTHLRQNPDISVAEVKEFVLDLFYEYDQSLEDHVARNR